MPRPARALSCCAFTTMTLAYADIEAEPLTVGDLIASSFDTLTIIIDFDRAQFPAVEDSIRSYWTAYPHIEAVRFIPVPADDESFRAGATLLYSTLETRADNPVFRSFRGTWLDALEREAPQLENVERTGLIAVGTNPFASPGFIGILAAVPAEFLPMLHHHYDSSQSLVFVYRTRRADCSLRFRLSQDHARDHRLVAIDGQPVLDFLAPVLEAISGERIAKKLTTFVWNQQTYWALLAPRSDREIELTTADRSGAVSHERVELISFDDHAQAFDKGGDQFQAGDFYEYHL